MSPCPHGGTAEAATSRPPRATAARTWKNRGVFVVVGVTGGIAAYKTVHLVRLLVLAGHDVHVVPTDAALRFVGLPTWESISRHPVTTSVFEDVAEVRHVALGRSADLVIVAPATADFLAKMTAGIAEDLLGTTLLATTAPVVVAPAMHTEMWRHPATTQNIETLRGRGVHIVGPADGPLTGGDSGPGRMSEPEHIFDRRDGALPRPATTCAASVRSSPPAAPASPSIRCASSATARAAVKASRSPSRRPIAARRSRSSSRTSTTACSARRRLAPASTIERVPTAAELAEATRQAASGADVIVMAAAVADYRAAEVAELKRSKEDAGGPRVSLELVENEDILAGLVASRSAGQTVVGFAAETATDAEDLRERGRRKRRRKGVDLLAVNEVGWAKGFETADNSVVLIDANDEWSPRRAAPSARWPMRCGMPSSR